MRHYFGLIILDFHYFRLFCSKERNNRLVMSEDDPPVMVPGDGSVHQICLGICAQYRTIKANEHQSQLNSTANLQSPLIYGCQSITLHYVPGDYIARLLTGPRGNFSVRSPRGQSLLNNGKFMQGAPTVTIRELVFQ